MQHGQITKYLYTLHLYHTLLLFCFVQLIGTVQNEMSKKTEAIACQRNPKTLGNRMGEMTSAFLIHCHPRQYRVFFIKQSVVYFVSHMDATQVAF